MISLTRRQFFAAIAAGAVVTAEGLWLPGTKLISIPKQIVVPPGFARIILENTDASNDVDPDLDPVAVGINGSVMLIPRGKPVNVPDSFVEVLDHSVQPGLYGGPPYIPYPYRRLA